MQQHDDDDGFVTVSHFKYNSAAGKKRRARRKRAGDGQERTLQDLVEQRRQLLCQSGYLERAAGEETGL
jgi:hypothetical protein